MPAAGRKLLIFCTLSVALLALCPDLHARQVTLQWNPNTESDLAGYSLYYGNYSGVYRWQVDVDQDECAANACTVTLDLSEGHWYFAAKAVDVNGNASPFSAEVHAFLTDGPGTRQFKSMPWLRLLLEEEGSN